jgi:hypothetical protein
MDKTTKLAIDALVREKQRIAFDANLFDLRLACTPHAKRCSERRKEIEGAIAKLKQEPVQLVLPFMAHKG